MKALTSAVQSGDITSAQQALTQLQQDSPRLAQALQSGDSSTDSSRISSLKSLASAVQSGDVSGAQNALAQLQQPGAGAAGGVHGHHHHHHAAQPDPTATDQSASDSAVTSLTDAAAGSIINLLA
jgi:ribosomal protein S20